MRVNIITAAAQEEHKKKKTTTRTTTAALLAVLKSKSNKKSSRRHVVIARGRLVLLPNKNTATRAATAAMLDIERVQVDIKLNVVVADQQHKKKRITCANVDLKMDVANDDDLPRIGLVMR